MTRNIQKSQGMEKTQSVGPFFMKFSIWKRTQISLLPKVVILPGPTYN